MAETQTTPVANATNEEKKLYVYYYSDPDGATKDLRFHAIYTDIAFSSLPWHVHAEKPSEDLKDPVWNNKFNGWVENSGTGQAQILAEYQKQIEDLTKTSQDYAKQNAEKDQQIDALQGAIQKSDMTTQALSMQFNQFGSQITGAIQQLTGTINTMNTKLDDKTAPATQPTAPAAQAQATSATQPTTPESGTQA